MPENYPFLKILKVFKFTTVPHGQKSKTAETTKYYLAVKLYKRNVLYAA